MKPLIVVSSRTGNTRLIARALQDAVGECGYAEASAIPEGGSINSVSAASQKK